VAGEHQDRQPRPSQGAEDWYFELKGKSRAGGLKKEKTFADAAKQFFLEYEAITSGERNPRYVKDHEATPGPSLRGNAQKKQYGQ
jgi:hypothetical protein